MNDVLILAIETSCDETAAAVVKNGREALSDIIYSQINIHRQYGGVVPEIASRKHIEKINQVTELALSEAGVALPDISAVAVTYGPGLAGALLVGTSFAKTLAFAAGLKLIGVHHIEGHICANIFENESLRPPFFCLVVSGGHSHLALVKDFGVYEVIGRSRDDAAGEAFDKVARALGLGYPGGPAIEAAAKTGDPQAIRFPRARVADAPYDFSFSGLKSAVLGHLNMAKMRGEAVNTADVAASFQSAVVEVLVERSLEAVEALRSETGCEAFAIAGGVAANTALREEFARRCAAMGIKYYQPPLKYCTDNAVMIAQAAYYEYKKGAFCNYELNAVPGLRLGAR